MCHPTWLSELTLRLDLRAPNSSSAWAGPHVTVKAPLGCQHPPVNMIGQLRMGRPASYRPQSNPLGVRGDLPVTCVEHTHDGKEAVALWSGSRAAVGDFHM